MDMKINHNKDSDNSSNPTPDSFYEYDTFFTNLYFGSIENLVYLVPCPGKIYNFDPNDFQNIQNESTIQSSLDNFHKLPLLGEEYKNIHCIGIPANDIIYIGLESEWISSENYNINFFDKLKSEYNSNTEDFNFQRNIKSNSENSQINNSATSNYSNLVVNKDNKINPPSKFCLIKVSKETILKEKLTEKDYIAGFQSGKRSCIVKLDKKFYRLKGCGNLSEGFPIQNMNFPKGAFELRGCQYRYSAIREAFMTEKISRLLSREYNLLTTNFPVDIWEFGEVQSERLGLKNELEKIKKYCSVYEAIGEKRLGCHLLPGIELIIAKFLDTYIKEKIVSSELVQEFLTCDDKGKEKAKVNDIAGEINGSDLNLKESNENFNSGKETRKNHIENILTEKIKKLESSVFQLFEEKRLEKAFMSKTKNDLNSFDNQTDFQKAESHLRNIYNPEKQIIATYEIVELIELDREKGERLPDLFSKHEIYKDASSGNMFKKLSEIVKSQSAEGNEILEIFSHKNIQLSRCIIKKEKESILSQAGDGIEKSNADEKTIFNSNEVYLSSRSSETREKQDEDDFEKLNSAKTQSNQDKQAKYFNLNFLIDDLPLDYIKTDDLKKHDNLDIHFQYSELQESVQFRINRIFDFLQRTELNFLDFIARIYQKLGYEAGKFKRILQDENINWGTYEDLPFRFHSNAHSDNFCVLPRILNHFNFNSESQSINKKNKDMNLLSILDFDLAFFRENFFNILAEEGKETFKKPDDCLYDFYICNERQVLEWEISGMENFLAFDHLKNKFESDNLFSFLYKPIIYLLRDTAVLGFREGYLLKEFEDKTFFENNASVIYDFIELGLLCSNHILG